METILENQYVVMYLDRDKELINDVWNDTSDEMTSEEFMAILIQRKELVIEYQLKKALIDTRKMGFVIEPKIQEWSAVNINKPVQNEGFQKIATLLPSSIFQQVAMEQIMTEYNEANDSQTHVFEDEELAKAWLFD